MPRLQELYTSLVSEDVLQTSMLMICTSLATACNESWLGGACPSSLICVLAVTITCRFPGVWIEKLLPFAYRPLLVDTYAWWSLLCAHLLVSFLDDLGAGEKI